MPKYNKDPPPQIVLVIMEALRFGMYEGALATAFRRSHTVVL